MAQSRREAGAACAKYPKGPAGRRHPSLCAIALIVLAWGGTRCAKGDAVLLSIRDVPPDGLVIARVDLSAAVQWAKLGPVAPEAVRAVLESSGKPAPCQFVPDDDFDGRRRVAGMFLLRLPEATDTNVRLEFGPAAGAAAKPFDGAVKTPSYTVEHDPKRSGGFPSSITFAATGKRFDAIRWNDRLHHRKLGSFVLSASNAQPKVRRISDGPLATVIRVEGRYTRGADQRPDSQAEAVYDWCYLRDRPLVYVTATIRQAKPFTWHETHFLELVTPGDDFLHWAGGEPLKRGEFSGTKKSLHFSNWGALVDGKSAIGMFRCGQVLFYDHIKGHGTYLQAHGDAAWRDWGSTRLSRSAWLWIGSADDPVEQIRAAARAVAPTDARAVVRVDAIRKEIDAVRKQAAELQREARRKALWRASAAEQLEARGRYAEALAAGGGKLPPSWTTVWAGEMALILERGDGGLRLLSLFDTAAGRELSAPDPPSLFRVTLRHSKTKEEVSLVADAGWGAVEAATVENQPAGATEIRWRKPAESRLAGLRVVARAIPDARVSAVRWKLTVDNVPAPWSVWRVVFPQVAVADPGPGAEVFFPRAAGEVKRDAWRRDFRFRGTYPSGWTSMPFMAAYSADRSMGLYVAMHDPLGSTKDVVVEDAPANHAVVFSFDHPAANMGVAGTGFALEGEGVWQLLRGDWFDAATIYRDWVRGHARWYPKLGPDGREDTPRWMRELPAWALSGGAPGACEKQVASMAKTLGVPLGFHWYSWHQIPFDNDYPHYFPTKKGFAESVARLQKQGVYVMPYINGRLWDTHDRGTEDFEFTKLARPATTKDEKGEPYLESYSSKESDGQRVRLAAMCPTTELWQKTVRRIVLRLMNECGVRGVYIDQVAAARPRLCFDKTHGHPLGGGHWWTEGYWKLLDAIRAEMPDDRMLTTECNGEPYIRCFDGYLTWHWQYDGQVPAFPAVYGGSIQMFGRAYRGGPTQNLALRMKAAQQLVFGEQIGWLNPSQLQRKENLEFFRPVVRLRWRLRRYFYAGEMARPPRLAGAIPRVTADWQWSGEWPVTTDAVMAGAWRLPSEKKLVLLFANVSDKPVTARVEYDASEYGFTGPAIKVTKITADASGESFTSPPKIARKVTFPPRATWAWEVTAE